MNPIVGENRIFVERMKSETECSRMKWSNTFRHLVGKLGSPDGSSAAVKHRTGRVPPEIGEIDRTEE